jgi:hypothetical protein
MLLKLEYNYRSITCKKHLVFDLVFQIVLGPSNSFDINIEWPDYVTRFPSKQVENIQNRAM